MYEAQLNEYDIQVLDDNRPVLLSALHGMYGAQLSEYDIQVLDDNRPVLLCFCD